jgi:hypothetical protein
MQPTLHEKQGKLTKYLSLIDISLNFSDFHGKLGTNPLENFPMGFLMASHSPGLKPSIYFQKVLMQTKNHENLR